MMDAAELARRWRAARNGEGPRCKLGAAHVDILVDALEQAQNINEFGLRALQVVEAQRDAAREDLDYEKAVSSARFKAVWEAISERDAAQQDAKDARALLGEIEEGCEDVDLSEPGLTHVEVVLSIEVINAIRATLASGGRDARLA